MCESKKELRRMKLIDADELLEMMYVRVMESQRAHFAFVDSDFEALVNDIPAVDVRLNVRGEWMISSDGYHPYCSECKTEPESGKMTKYCPECGADMRGKNDENKEH